MDLGLKDKVAIVNGASQGIGYAIAHALASEGAIVIMTARREAALTAAAERLASDTNTTPILVAADIRSRDDCARICKTAADKFGVVDVLVNNDGAPPLGPALDFDDAAWGKAV